MFKKLLALLMLPAICLTTGCLSLISTSGHKIDQIEGDIQCEFRVGKDAQWHKRPIETDVVFDKDKFVDLFNERENYNANVLKYDVDDCTMKVRGSEEPEKWVLNEDAVQPDYIVTRALNEAD